VCGREIQRQFRADDRFDSSGERCLVKPWRAVNAIAIEERQRGITEIGGAIDQDFRE